jgi:aspartyl-tRNA(Asn)/glutamyl-tRNA(Gln) amidotransferase subunit A
MGFAIEKVSLPNTQHALSTYYIILPAEASSNLARYDGIRYARHPELANDYLSERGAGFGPEVKRRIILGTFVLSSGYYDAYYKKAQAVRTLVAHDFEKAFRQVDVLLTPVAPTTAFKLGEKSDNPLELYLQDIFTIPANLAGVPAISIPVKKQTGLPVGFQLIGRHFREADILALGKAYESS